MDVAFAAVGVVSGFVMPPLGSSDAFEPHVLDNLWKSTVVLVIR
jgi:hypothetical protein